MRYFILPLLMALAPVYVFSQMLKISGVVVDENGAPLQGANLIIESVSQATVSDSGGGFYFVLPPDEYIMIVSYLGFQTRIITIKTDENTDSIHIVLSPLIKTFEEVVIRDNYSDLRKQEEALNIEIVNHDYLVRHLSGNLMKTLENMPGVSGLEIGAGHSKPMIRGIGFNRIVVVENGIKHESQQWGSDHGLEIDQYAVNNIEVVKGPSSLIYGSDAIGGVVILNTSTLPSPNTFGGSLLSTFRSNNMLFGNSIRLFGRKNSWYADFRLSKTKYSDYRVPADSVSIYSYNVHLHKNRLRNTAGKEDAVHFSVGYVGNNFQSVLITSLLQSSAGFFANAHGLEPRRVDTDVHDKSSRDILHPRQDVEHYKIVSRNTKYRSNGKTILDLGFQKNIRDEFSNYVNHGFMPPIFPDDLNISPSLERRFNKYTFSAMLIDEFNLKNISGKVGVNAEYQNNKTGGYSFIIPDYRYISSGVFSYIRKSFNEKVLIHAGLRYDIGNIESDESFDWFNSPYLVSVDTSWVRLRRADYFKRTFHSLTWSSGFNYTNGNLHFKTHIGKSFRMPIAKELASNGVNYHGFSYEKGSSSLNPESSYQWDAGVYIDYDKFELAVNPFINYFPNYIYLNPTSGYDYLYGAGNQVFQYTQSEVFRYGGEIQISYNLSSLFKTGLSADYVHSEQLSGEKAGFGLPFSPPPSILINFSITPSQRGGLVNKYISLDYRYTAKQNKIVPPERKTPAYSLLDLSAGGRLIIKQSYIDIHLRVNNLFNTRYFNHLSYYRIIGLPEAGRNFGISLKIPLEKQLLITKT